MNRVKAISKPARIEIDLRYTEQEYQKIIKGFVPQQMEDKWAITFESDYLSFRRSWTGDEIYKAKFTKEGDFYYIREFWVRRDRDRYNYQKDDKDIKLLLIFIDK